MVDPNVHAALKARRNVARGQRILIRLPRVTTACGCNLNGCKEIQPWIADAHRMGGSCPALTLRTFSAHASDLLTQGVESLLAIRTLYSFSGVIHRLSRSSLGYVS